MNKRQKILAGGDISATMLLGSKFISSSVNPLKYYDIVPSPEDSVSSMAFSPACLTQNFLIAGSWDNCVRCWEVETSGKTIPKSMQSMQEPVLDVCWKDDGTKVFMAGGDRSVKCWDLITNQSVTVAVHDAPIKTCHWIKTSLYSCLMTGSWDKSLKFWDIRSPQAIRTFCLPDRCYCADVVYPMAVVGTADKKIIVYRLEGGPREYTRLDSSLKLQIRCIAIFKTKEGSPEGYAVGSVEGKVAIQYINQQLINFSFKCHRTECTAGCQDIYAVNGIAFHPVHGTFATVGSDGRFIFWDKDARTNLYVSEFMDQSITTCAFSQNGQIFAYSVCYDWSKGHEFNDPMKKNKIYLRPCCEELKPSR